MKIAVNVVRRRLDSYIVNDVSKEVLSPYLMYLKESYGNSPEDRIWSSFATPVIMFPSKRRHIAEDMKVKFYIDTQVGIST
jgi:hypothetical protein